MSEYADSYREGSYDVSSPLGSEHPDRRATDAPMVQVIKAENGWLVMRYRYPESTRYYVAQDESELPAILREATT